MRGSTLIVPPPLTRVFQEILLVSGRRQVKLGVQSICVHQKLLPDEELLKFFSLFRIFLDTKVIHWDKLNLICISQWWVNSFPVDEFAHLGQDLHTFVAKKKINESLPRIRVRGLVAEDSIMPISQHLSQPNIVYGCSLLSIGECINDITTVPTLIEQNQLFAVIEHFFRLIEL